MKQPASLVKSIGLVVVVAVGCGNDGGDSTFTAGGNGGSSANAGSGPILNGPGGNGAGGASGNSGGGNGGAFPIGPGGIPAGFTKANIGAWKRGNPITGAAGATGADAGSGTGCGSVLTAVVRDFRDGKQANGHPDFQRDDPDADSALTGIVKATLGTDRKPGYAPAAGTDDTTSPAAFRPWYVNTNGVNQPFVLHLFLTQQPGGKYTFYSNAFFPLDKAGFGNQGNEHNYHFTTEVHTEFRYKGGETFAFEGDDDLWVFINRRLAIDLGGLHVAIRRQVNLDADASRLGITVGQTYTLDLFHAERHTVDSNFRIDTNLEFVNCGTIIQDPIK
jgi:fibro-slime domain-containing protein